MRPKKRTPLIRTPESWATDHGWVSRLRAKRAAARLRDLGRIIDGALNADEDEGVRMWIDELEEIAAYLAPEKTPAQRRRFRLPNERRPL